MQERRARHSEAGQQVGLCVGVLLVDMFYFLPCDVNRRGSQSLVEYGR